MTRRFVVTEDVLEYALADKYIKKCLMLTDYHWYCDNEKPFEDWLRIHGCAMPGMIIKFPDEQTMTLFLLRWE